MRSTKTPREAAKPKTSTAAERVAASALQREYIRRLREAFADLKARSKHAKSCLEAAIDDLERMADAGAPGVVFPGALVVDTATGEIKNYRSLLDLEAEAAREKEDAEKAKAEALDTTSSRATPAKAAGQKGTPEVEEAFEELGYQPSKRKKFGRDRAPEARP